MRAMAVKLSALALGILACSLHTDASAQAPTTFEAVSIHRNESGSQNTHINVAGGRVTITNASLKTLIRNAYALQSFQFAGGPGWLDSEMYDIVATTGASDDIAPDQMKALLKDLLADRFKMTVHWETRQMSIYALVPGKDGAKLKASSSSDQPSINTQKTLHKGRMIGGREPTAILASNLGNQLGTIVLDKTGLQGAFDWTLEWDPNPEADSTEPSLFAALQEQLGLRLEPEKGPVQVLVVESAERAPEN